MPIRRAPARPGGKSQAQSRRFSLNEVWGDPSAQSNNVPNVIRVNAAKTTYLTTNVLRPSPITGVVDDKFKASHEPLQLQQLSSGTIYYQWDMGIDFFAYQQNITYAKSLW